MPAQHPSTAGQPDVPRPPSRPPPDRIATNGPMEPVIAQTQHTSIVARGKSLRRLHEESDESGRLDARVRFAAARGEPGEALPGQGGQLVGQLGGVQRPALVQPPGGRALGHAHDRRGQGPRPRGGQAGLGGDDRRHPAGHPAPERGHLLLEVGVEAEGLGEQQAEGVLVPVDEVDVGSEPAPQPLLVALGLAEGGLQLLGEPAQLAGQQGLVQRPLGGEVLVEHGLGDAGGLGDGLHGGAPVAVAGEQPPGDTQQLGAALGRPQPHADRHAHDSTPLRRPARSRILPFSRLPSGNSSAGKDLLMIGFALSEDQVAAQKWAREFAEREIRPVAPHYDETEDFPWPVLSKAADIGLYGMDFYRMIGEDETGILQPLLVEELCWGCAGISLGIFGSGLPLVALIASGTPDQVTRWTPELFGTPAEPKVGAFAVTEPGAGSDVSSLRTRAVRDGDDWVLNGQKVFITNGGIASLHVVVATVDPTLGHRGQASFVVPPGTPGLRQGKKERKLGIRASHTAEVLLEDCRVPADCLLGGEQRLQAKLERARDAQAAGAASAAQASPRPRGGSGALATFEATRPIVGAQAVGIARAAFEFARDYARERVQFGKPIAAQQAIAFKLAAMATEIDAARLLVWRAAWMARNGMGFSHAEGSMSKLKAGEVATRVTDEAIQILGLRLH